MRKEKQMDRQTQEELYREYADTIAEENGDLYGTERFRKLLSASSVFEVVDKLKSYEEALLKRAMKEVRSSKEWKALEVEDTVGNTVGVRRHMYAGELLEHYKSKIQRSYKAEQWHLEHMNKCDTEIATLNSWRSNSKAKKNRLKHWMGVKLKHDIKLREYVAKSHRYEMLIYKWQSICELLKEATVAKDIAREKSGNGNQYGFNPYMRSRETAIDMFMD